MIIHLHVAVPPGFEVDGKFVSIRSSDTNWA